MGVIHFAPSFGEYAEDEGYLWLQISARNLGRAVPVQPRGLPGLEAVTSTNSSCQTVKQSRNTLVHAPCSQVSLSKPSQQHQG